MIIKNITPENFSWQPNKKLLLFFTGWGMDENPFLEYCPADSDFMVAYDYSTLSFDDTLLAPYNEISIVAWSIGVWAASQLLQSKNYPIAERIAVNGTHFLVDDEKGIPHKIFNGTLDGLNERTLYKFRQRMCGQTTALNYFLKKAPTRNISSLRTELASIGKLSFDLPTSYFKWDKIYIGKQDKIFSADNQIRAWKGGNYIVTDVNHYAEDLWKEIFNPNKHVHE